MMLDEEVEEKSVSRFQGRVEEPVRMAMVNSKQTADQARVRRDMVQAWYPE
jgi:hypothetical protein